MPLGLTDEDLQKGCDLPHFRDVLSSVLAPYRAGAWRQTGRGEDSPAVCMGMCLDWIRRILTGKAKFDQGGSAVLGPKDGKGKDASRFKKVIQTHGIYNRVQKEVVAEVRLKRLQQAVLTRVLPSIQKLDVALAGVKTLEQAQKAIEALYSVDSDGAIDYAMKVQDEFEKILVVYSEECQQLGQKKPTGRDTLELRIELQNAIHERFATEWTEKLPKSHMLFSSKPRTNNFQKTRIRRITSPLISDDGPLFPSQVLAYVEMQLGCLRGGGCAVMSIAPVDGSGHDVAFHRTSNKDVLYYFDPNLGEFRFQMNELQPLGLLLWAGWRAVYQPKNYGSVAWVEFAPA